MPRRICPACVLRLIREQTAADLRESPRICRLCHAIRAQSMLTCQSSTARNLSTSRLAITCAAVILVGATLPAVAATHCSIHPPKGASDVKLPSMAKISKAQAEQYARARLRHLGSISTSSAELEAEHDCLIWSFDMKVRGKSGVQEVNIDAGNGKVLNVHHESAGAEASESGRK